MIFFYVRYDDNRLKKLRFGLCAKQGVIYQNIEQVVLKPGIS
jgi:hypothetical protein